MIELIDFSKKYSQNDDFAVEKVNLKAECGCVTGLLGLNGAGKTTIIKAICGQHYPTEGKIFVSGKSNDNTKSLGYVPEQFDLPENLTTLEFLRFTCNLYSSDVKNEKTAETNLEKTIRLCQLESVLHKKMGQISKGFKQRVCFAQALVHDPENLVLDEPVNGLDPAQIIGFRKMIKKATETKTVLISTHLMQEVEALCDKIYILSKGKIAACGTAQEIISASNSKSIEEAFLKITGGVSNEELS